jgi:hypothetical protein
VPRGVVQGQPLLTVRAGRHEVPAFDAVVFHQRG